MSLTTTPDLEQDSNEVQQDDQFDFDQYYYDGVSSSEQPRPSLSMFSLMDTNPEEGNSEEIDSLLATMSAIPSSPDAQLLEEMANDLARADVEMQVEQPIREEGEKMEIEAKSNIHPEALELPNTGIFSDSPLLDEHQQEIVPFTDFSSLGLPESTENIPDFDMDVDADLPDYDFYANRELLAPEFHSWDLASLLDDSLSFEDNINQAAEPMDAETTQAISATIPTLYSPTPIHPQIFDPMLYTPASPSFGLESSSPPQNATVLGKRPLEVEEDEGAFDTGKQLSPKRHKANLYTYHPEKPKVDPEHAWVKINATAKATTRSGKINTYQSSVHYGPPKPSPVGPWTDGTHSFTYKPTGEIDAPGLTAEQIKAFIANHPGQLSLFIQRSPADSARRYPDSSLSTCRFAECPSRIHGYHGTIMAGHYRVSFDEKFAVYGSSSDPYLVAFNAHLYCVERFLDLPALCARFSVAGENRNYTATEPYGRFNGLLAGGDADVVQAFVGTCKNAASAASSSSSSFSPSSSAVGADAMAFRQHYPNYPTRAAWQQTDDPEKLFRAHRGALNYMLQEVNLAERPDGRKKQLLEQGRKGTNLVTHLGDVQMLTLCRADKRRERNRARKTEMLRRKRALRKEAELQGRVVEREDVIEEEEEL